jgi:hypothetical protein
VSRFPIRTETMLVLACAGAAGILAASQFMTIFEFTPPGGEALADQSAFDQHSAAVLVIAVFALLALVLAVALPSKPLAAAVAFLGLSALLFFLLGDLPDANQVGTLDDERESFIDAKAEPQLGFWLELVGSLVLTICGVALATLTPDQLQQAARPAGDSFASRGSRAETARASAGSSSAPQGNPQPSEGKRSREAGIRSLVRSFSWPFRR